MMALPDEIEEELGDNEAIVMEPRCDYDQCIIGVGHRFASGPLAVYSIPAVLAVLEGWGMSEEEADEYFRFNVLGAWLGDGTPVFVDLI